jgi:hypothetical protein
MAADSLTTTGPDGELWSSPAPCLRALLAGAAAQTATGAPADPVIATVAHDIWGARPQTDARCRVLQGFGGVVLISARVSPAPLPGALCPKFSSFRGRSGLLKAGMVLGRLGYDLITGLDLDTCIDGGGAIALWAVQQIRAFKTYTEVPCSSTGVKLLFPFHPATTPTLQPFRGGATQGKR